MGGSSVKINTPEEVKAKFNSYPTAIRNKLSTLRKLVHETAKEVEGIERLEEALKWGEPSFLVKGGSTIRIDWKEKTPDQIAMYFKCTSKIVPSIKKKYGDLFCYEKTRALVFKHNAKIPREELKDCIKLALKYHSIKQNL